MTRLVALHPEFMNSGGPGISQPSAQPCLVCGGARCDKCHHTGKEYEPAPLRTGVGLAFDCPHGEACPKSAMGGDDPELRAWYRRHYVDFANPLDGGPSVRAEHAWQRTGETFDTLTLTPSIHSVADKGGCGWHGFITNGEVTGA